MRNPNSTVSPDARTRWSPFVWPAYAPPSARSRPRGQGMQRTPGSGPGWSRARRADRTRTLRAV